MVNERRCRHTASVQLLLLQLYWENPTTVILNKRLLHVDTHHDWIISFLVRGTSGFGFSPQTRWRSHWRSWGVFGSSSWLGSPSELPRSTKEASHLVHQAANRGLNTDQRPEPRRSEVAGRRTNKMIQVLTRVSRTRSIAKFPFPAEIWRREKLDCVPVAPPVEPV